MTNKKLFAIILSAVVLSAVTSIAAYKIFSKNTTFVPSQTQSNPNFESIVDTIDYSENLLDSNQVYKERFEPELNSQGRWIPIKSTELIKELTTPDEETIQQPEVQNVSNDVTANETPKQNLVRENTSVAKYNTPSENIQQVETQTNTNQIVEEKKTTEVKIVYIWQPNECSGSSWNPYTYGRWEFTSCGWMWRSHYRWGNHCYNYGRWFWSSYYGWVWMPGGRWAPNWVTWRHCNDYYGSGYYAWYPTTPRIYWRDYVSNLVVCNSHFTSNPVHWTVVPVTNITKTITDGTKVKPEKNAEVLSNTSKVKTINTLAIDDQKIKYTGPNVNEVSNVTKTTITPKKVDIPNEVAGNNGTKQTTTSDPYVKIKPVKNTVVTDPAIYNEVTNTPKVSNPVKSTEPTKTTITKTEPVKTADPTKTNIKNEPTKTTTTAPPTKTTTETPKEPVKQNPTKTPKQDPPTTKTPKQDPPITKTPKYDPPKQNDPPPTRNDPPPTRNDPPPKQDPPVKSPPPPPPPKQEAPKNPPPKKDDTGKKGD